MKKYLFLLVISALLAGCNNGAQDRDVVVKINNYEITRQEFEQEFADSSFSRQGTPGARMDFLNSLINRQLILQDAQANDLDKSRQFIEMIQKFWEQSLLKAALDKASKEISNAATIDDSSVEVAYNKIFSEGKTDKSYSSMYQQIKWELKQARESELMDNWLQELRKKTRIVIDQSISRSDK